MISQIGSITNGNFYPRPLAEGGTSAGHYVRDTFTPSQPLDADAKTDAAFLAFLRAERNGRATKDPPPTMGGLDSQISGRR